MPPRRFLRYLYLLFLFFQCSVVQMFICLWQDPSCNLELGWYAASKHPGASVPHCTGVTGPSYVTSCIDIRYWNSNTHTAITLTYWIISLAQSFDLCLLKNKIMYHSSLWLNEDVTSSWYHIVFQIWLLIGNACYFCLISLENSSYLWDCKLSTLLWIDTIKY